MGLLNLVNGLKSIGSRVAVEITHDLVYNQGHYKLHQMASNKELEKYNVVVERIHDYSEELKQLSDKELKEKKLEFQNRYMNGESLDEMLPEAYAVVKEVIDRQLGMRKIFDRSPDEISDKTLGSIVAQIKYQISQVLETHNISGEVFYDFPPQLYEHIRKFREETKDNELRFELYDEQLLGGILLSKHKKAAEILTGEGKTFVAALPAYLSAIAGKPVQIATANPYLAQRDAEQMKPVFEALGISSGYNFSNDQLQRTAFEYLRLVNLYNVAGNKVTPSETISGRTGVDISHIQELENKILLLHQALSEMSVPVELLHENPDLAVRIAKKNNYREVTYGTIDEFVFDYMRDCRVNDKAARVQNGHGHIIIDEADDVLVDKVTSPFVISGEETGVDNNAIVFDKIAKALSEEDYVVYDNFVDLTESGREKVGIIAAELGMPGLFKKKELNEQEQDFLGGVYTALKANYLLKQDVDYIVDGDEIRLIEKGLTDRILYGRRYSDGLHTALEAKHDLKPRSYAPEQDRVTVWSYLALFDKVSAMTGTADAKLFNELYGLETVAIPPHKPSQRVDEHFELYVDLVGKTYRIMEELVKAKRKGNPVLVGTTSVPYSEALRFLLSIDPQEPTKNILESLNANPELRNKVVSSLGLNYSDLAPETQKSRYRLDEIIEHVKNEIFSGGNPFLEQGTVNGSVQLLNACEVRDYHKEQGIIKGAGVPGKVTIGTGMAGRGADIKIILYGPGSHVDDSDLETSEKEKGLTVIVTEPLETRIYRQLIGRAGRQGQPGRSIQIYSLLDEAVLNIHGFEMESPTLGSRILRTWKKWDEENVSRHKYFDILRELYSLMQQYNEPLDEPINRKYPEWEHHIREAISLGEKGKSTQLYDLRNTSKLEHFVREQVFGKKGIREDALNGNILFCSDDDLAQQITDVLLEKYSPGWADERFGIKGTLVDDSWDLKGMEEYLRSQGLSLQGLGKVVINESATPESTAPGEDHEGRYNFDVKVRDGTKLYKDELQEYLDTVFAEKIASERARLNEQVQEIASRARATPDAIIKSALLRLIDDEWSRFILQAQQLRRGVGLLAYGQKDPLVEYGIGLKNAKEEMFDRIDAGAVSTILRITPPAIEAKQ